MKYFFIILFTGLFTLINAQVNQLPKPSGNYQTGVTYIRLIDQTRKEIFNNQGDKREFTVKIWYPSDTATIYEPYFENAESMVGNYQFPEIYRNLITHSSKDVPVSKIRESYPVIILSHGMGGHFSQNTILMEELASNGYIIFSIAHHYTCSFTFYPDGTMKMFNLNDLTNEKIKTITNEMQNPEVVQYIRKIGSASDDKERMEIFHSLNDIMPTAFVEATVYQAKDVSFLINQLKDLNEKNSILKGKINENLIGVIGWSMGAFIAGEVCISDSRVSCGVNMDGAIYGRMAKTKIKTPFMFLNSNRFYGYEELFATRSEKECYSITVKNSDHYNFTDYSILPSSAEIALGSIDGEQAIELTNEIVLSFFNKYLKQISGNHFSDLSERNDIAYTYKKNKY